MNREIKFRDWDKEHKSFIYSKSMPDMGFWKWVAYDSSTPFCQFTGLTDKNGKEIYEFMELDSKYEVIYQAPSYVLKDISTSDIIPLYGNKYEVTKEYTKI